MSMVTVMGIFKKLLGASERRQLRQELSRSVEFQDNLMMVDIAKIVHKVPEGSSVIAFRKYRGTLHAGLVVPSGSLSITLDLMSKGLLNPDGTPGAWRLISPSKLDLLKEFDRPPEGALAYFALTPTG
jgi:hypothetical protein